MCDSSSASHAGGASSRSVRTYLCTANPASVIQLWPSRQCLCTQLAPSPVKVWNSSTPSAAPRPPGQVPHPPWHRFIKSYQGLRQRRRHLVAEVSSPAAAQGVEQQHAVRGARDHQVNSRVRRQAGDGVAVTRKHVARRRSQWRAAAGDVPNDERRVAAACRVV